MEVLVITTRSTRVATCLSGMIWMAQPARLVGSAAATGTTTRSTCRPPSGSRTARRSSTSASVFVSQVPQLPLTSLIL